MAALDRDLRRQLERTIVAARDEAEAGAHAALEALAVHHHEPYPHMSAPQRALRNRLRSHARQLGDTRDERRGTQAIDHLVQECAYEHWHRMLFARFLAENELLIEPDSGVSISIDECSELARDQNLDQWELASRFAQRMLPQIFRPDDPVLQVSLSPEHRGKLEHLLADVPGETFRADDSLGWAYQYWQAKRKEEVDASGKKIGADELPPVTQLFTEHYMVRFVLHNTIGAWHAGRILVANPDIARTAQSEDELRRACALPGYQWEYLRFMRDNDDAPWRPAAGAFEAWPRTAREIKLLDPCSGSGHFLVAGFSYLVRLRMHDEGLSREDATRAVLAENIHGLEIDPRCTQIGAFALALAAWKFVGRVVPLPRLNLACSGLPLGVSKAEWVKLAGTNQHLREGMERLYQLFEQAPLLGSLINPVRETGDLITADLHSLLPLIQQAVANVADETAIEVGVAAQGMALASSLLARSFHLIVTNVPYLTRGKQDQKLKEFADRYYPLAKHDLATMFLERCLEFSVRSGTAAAVTPQNWFFLGSYTRLREHLLRDDAWHVAVRLGPAAFQEMNWWAANTAIAVISRGAPNRDAVMIGLDASATRVTAEKPGLLVGGAIEQSLQRDQLQNPDCRIAFGQTQNRRLLSQYADSYWGLGSGDYSRFGRVFWEIPSNGRAWIFQMSTVQETTEYGGREHILCWEEGAGALVNSPGAFVRGTNVWGKQGVLVSQMRHLPVTLYTGEAWDSNSAPIIPKDVNHLPAIWAFCTSPEYYRAVRAIDQKTNVTNATLVKVPFELDRWTAVAAEKYPDGLPPPYSEDLTQWVFKGTVAPSQRPLQVALGRLAGYRWPEQSRDDLDDLMDEHGIVCFGSLKGDAPAAERLGVMLARCFGDDWSSAKLASLLSAEGDSSKNLDEWLRENFFARHCVLFHHRPFIWHIWDGRRDGFHALVNYHKLAEGDGKGRKLLETLTYSYLGDWITRQRAAIKEGEVGAEARLSAALELQQQLTKIVEGEPPCDIFVRWKPLHQQPIGWEPDINDGVRINIRPFMSATLSGGRAGAGVLRWKPNIKWEKDRGKEPVWPKDEYPWFWNSNTYSGERRNDVHLSNAEKRAARARFVGGKEQRA